jgi:hypothetical protein
MLESLNKMAQIGDAPLYMVNHMYMTLEMRKFLRRIKKDVDEPWMMVGDFNFAMWHTDLSVTKSNERKMENFRNVLYNCSLHVLIFLGLLWTYNNK